MRCQRIRYRRVGSHKVDCDKSTGDPKLPDDIAVDNRDRVKGLETRHPILKAGYRHLNSDFARFPAFDDIRAVPARLQLAQNMHPRVIQLDGKVLINGPVDHLGQNGHLLGAAGEQRTVDRENRLRAGIIQPAR